MTDEAQTPGESPADGQAPEQDATDKAEDQKEYASLSGREAHKLRKEAQKLRQERKQAEADAEALRAKVKAFEAEKAAAKEEAQRERGEFKELWEQEQAKTEKIKARLVEQELSKRLAAAGIKPEQQKFLLPNIKASADVTVDDDFNVVGDFQAQIDEVVSAFGLSQEPSEKQEQQEEKPAPTLNRSAELLSQQLPTEAPKRGRNAQERFRSKLISAL